ncbi:MAG: ribosome biogenesis GTPase YlqF [Pseudomonadota bacterium]
MSINWFPGHMAVAVEKIKKAMKDHDLVIEVLDARCPMASANPLIATLRTHRQRPCLKVLNKMDLADPNATSAWLTFFSAQKNVQAIALSAKKPGDAMKIVVAAKKLAPHRNDNFKPLRMLIMGVPNVGKSTLINALLKQRKAKVGDEPAVTKALARYDLSSTASLTDTPGLMWPRIEHASDGLMLAASHIIGTKAYIESEVAVFLAEILLARYPQALAARYGVPGDDKTIDGVSVIETVAAKRGYRLKGGGLDFDKAAITLMTDYRGGALGRVSLETPSTFKVRPVILNSGDAVESSPDAQ